MIPGVPVGTVCAYAGHVTPSTQGKNTIWPSTDPSKDPNNCGGADTIAGAVSGVPGDAPAPAILIEVMGWMLCDGRSLGVAQYPELYRVLGTTYCQNTDARGQTFRIPDYRGLFLRGTDDGAGMDAFADRMGPPGQVTDSGVGSMQCDALQTHTHKYNAVNLAAQAESGQAAALTNQEPEPSTGEPDACRISKYETRPKNVAVNYIIKCLGDDSCPTRSIRRAIR